MVYGQGAHATQTLRNTSLSETAPSLEENKGSRLQGTQKATLVGRGHAEHLSRRNAFEHARRGSPKRPENEHPSEIYLTFRHHESPTMTPRQLLRHQQRAARRLRHNPAGR